MSDDAIKRAREAQNRWCMGIDAPAVGGNILHHSIDELTSLLESSQAEVEDYKTKHLAAVTELLKENASLKQRVAELERANEIRRAG